jgi:hypothetical protein
MLRYGWWTCWFGNLISKIEEGDGEVLEGVWVGWGLEMGLKESGRRMVCFGRRVQRRDGEILKRMVAMLVGCWGS